MDIVLFVRVCVCVCVWCVVGFLWWSSSTLFDSGNFNAPEEVISIIYYIPYQTYKHAFTHSWLHQQRRNRGDKRKTNKNEREQPQFTTAISHRF